MELMLKTWMLDAVTLTEIPVKTVPRDERVFLC